MKTLIDEVEDLNRYHFYEHSYVRLDECLSLIRKHEGGAGEVELRVVLAETLKEIVLGNEWPNALVTKLRPYLRTPSKQPDDGWQSFETAPHWQEILVYREDAGVFIAIYDANETDDEPAWWGANGEDLTGDLPTLWRSIPTPSKAALASLGQEEKKQ